MGGLKRGARTREHAQGAGMTDSEDVKKAKERLAELAREMEKSVGGKPFVKITLGLEGPMIESFSIPIEGIPIILLMVASAISNGSTDVQKVSLTGDQKVN